MRFLQETSHGPAEIHSFIQQTPWPLKRSKGISALLPKCMALLTFTFDKPEGFQHSSKATQESNLLQICRGMHKMWHKNKGKS